MYISNYYSQPKIMFKSDERSLVRMSDEQKSKECFENDPQKKKGFFGNFVNRIKSAYSAFKNGYENFEVSDTPSKKEILLQQLKEREEIKAKSEPLKVPISDAELDDYREMVKQKALNYFSEDKVDKIFTSQIQKSAEKYKANCDDYNSEKNNPYATDEMKDILDDVMLFGGILTFGLAAEHEKNSAYALPAINALLDEPMLMENKSVKDCFSCIYDGLHRSREGCESFIDFVDALLDKKNVPVLMNDNVQNQMGYILLGITNNTWAPNAKEHTQNRREFLKFIQQNPTLAQHSQLGNYIMKSDDYLESCKEQVREVDSVTGKGHDFKEPKETANEFLSF